MEALIYCSNFTKTEAIENYVRERIEPLLDKLSGHRVNEIRVHLTIENSREHPGPNVFECRVQVRCSGARDIVVSKRSENLYKSVAMAAKTLHRLMPERSYSHTRRRTDSKRERGFRGLASRPWADRSAA